MEITPCAGYRTFNDRHAIGKRRIMREAILAWTTSLAATSGTAASTRGFRSTTAGMGVQGERPAEYGGLDLSLPTNFVDVLRGWTQQVPHRVCFQFVEEAGVDERRMTYGELDKLARRIAVRLQQSHLQGERALLLFQPGLDYVAAFFGCLYAGVVAVPAYPPRQNRTLDRLEAVALDATAKVALTTSGLRDRIQSALREWPGLAEMEFAAVDELTRGIEDDWRPPKIDEQTLAFLQYTSGSTGSPKGVMLSHRNLIANSRLIQSGFEHNEKCIGVIWLPPFHDMGLIGGILQPILIGGQSVLMSPSSFASQPIRWLQAISHYRATTSGGPNFAYDLCARRISPEQCEGLDLSSWSVAFCGAEPIHAAVFDRFVEAFGRIGFRREAFYPCYGMAETTLIVTGGEKSAPPRVRRYSAEALGEHRAIEDEGPTARSLVGCGRPLGDFDVRIVDARTCQPVDPTQIGEIWIRGASVAQGYWGKEEQTAETFGARLADGDGPFLRTGDYGFFRDGELFVVGRIRDIVIIRGRNYHPQDIEASVGQCHPDLLPGNGVAFSVPSEETEQLVIVHEVRRGFPVESAPEVFGAIRAAISKDFELAPARIVLIRCQSIPKTSSGKLQRSQCREALLSNSLKVIAEWSRSTSPSPEPAKRSAARSRSATEIQDWIAGQLASRLAVPIEQIELDRSMADFGLDSINVLRIFGELEKWLGRPVSPTACYEHPTIRSLALWLSGQPATERRRTNFDRRSEPNRSAAIIGAACRFPGASSPAQLWQLLSEGRSAVRPLPGGRWDDARHDFIGAIEDLPAATRWGGFIDGVDLFDARFFGISPREASRLDPQQRMLLETTWEALENAGVAPSSLSGTRTGVFLGISHSDYARIQNGDVPVDNAYSATGSALSIAANRLSYFFNWKGPSLSVDTACSSSLVALHLAMQSLRSGECDVAVVAGSNVILSPALSIPFATAGMLSPEGRCKTFDAEADGYVRGEGCGVVILKRTSDASQSGDRILAIVRGSAVNQDGRSNGLTAPNSASQVEVIRSALADAGVAPQEVSYVEVHGTGTSLGDPIEFEAIRASIGETNPAAPECVLGSIKTNIGHLEPASGTAGLLKVVLMMQHGQIPPHLHLNRINPLVKIDGSRFRIATSLEPWPGGSRPRIAGVSSFGFGGANAHVVLQEPPAISAAVASSVERPRHFLVLSAKTPTALELLARSYRDRIASLSDDAFADLCFSANSGRELLEHRLVLDAQGREEAVQRLDDFLDGRKSAGLSTGDGRLSRRPKIAFLFPGQGAQYVDMGRNLFETQPTFRRWVLRAAEILDRRLDRPLLSLLYPEASSPSSSEALKQTRILQPALFAIEVALAELWQSWGVRPDIVLGHSLGEYAAACVARVFSFEEGLELVASRAEAIDRLCRPGAMAAILADEERVLRIIENDNGVALAAVNGPQVCVVSGETDAVEEVQRRAAADGIATRRLEVSHAFHSPLVEPALGPFFRQASQVSYKPPTVSLISNLTGKVVESVDADYWRRHLREPVRFHDGVAAIANESVEIFLEVGPGATLSSLARRCLGKNGAAWLTSIQSASSDWSNLLGSLRTAVALGAPFDGAGFDNEYARRRIDLPNYPFERRRHWFQRADISPAMRESSSPTGRRLPLPIEDAIFEFALGRESTPLVKDHCVQGAVVVPGVWYLCQAILCAEQLTEAKTGSWQISNVSFRRPLALGKESQRTVQAVLTGQGDARGFRVFALDGTRPQHSASWSLHAEGIVASKSGRSAFRTPVPIDAIRTRLAEGGSDGDAFYAAGRERGLDYGPSFRWVHRLAMATREAVCEMRPASQAELETNGGLLPGLLDACLQVLGAAVDGAAQSAGPLVPVHIENAELHPVSSGRHWCQARLRDGLPATDSHGFVGDVRLMNDAGDVVLELHGVHLVPLDSGEPPRAHSTPAADWMYEVVWNEMGELRPADRSAGVNLPWLVFSDSSGAGAALASAVRSAGRRCVEVFAGDRFHQESDDRFEVNPLRDDDFHSLLESIAGQARAGTNGHNGHNGHNGNGKSPATSEKWRIAYLWGLDVSSIGGQTGRETDRQRVSCGGLMHLAKALFRLPLGRVLIATRGCQSVRSDDVSSVAPVNGAIVQAAQAPLWGLAGVLATEHPEHDCLRLDLDPADTSESMAAALWQAFEIERPSGENQLAIRRGRRYVPRLVQRPSMHAPTTLEPVGLEATTKGVLDSLQWRARPRISPGPGQVEIEVRAVGLNFRDVLNALDLYPGDAGPLGGECAGRIVSVGPDVDHFHVGDDVVAIAWGCFGTYVTTDAHLVALKPRRLDFAAAATIPIAFLTAHYGLFELAKVSAGQQVLIHAASGGVGLAAIQLALRAGAIVHGTAGSQAKREYLIERGCKGVANSRTPDFAAEVQTWTEGRGVDVVLNCLTGESIGAGLASVGPGGAFVEIGRGGIWSREKVASVRSDVRYFPFALDELVVDEPARLGRILKEIVAAVDCGELSPLPLQVFPASQTTGAFGLMSRARHIGKVVVVMDAARPAPSGPLFRADATYVITGGTGGIGPKLATWMARHGAKRLVLLARRAPSVGVSQTIRELHERGCQVRIESVDVANRDQVRGCLEAIRAEGPPIRGVFHAAGVLDDGILLKQDWSRFERVFAPKIDGAWNLHEETLGDPLDYFVAFSSIATVLGSPGQSNYAAANAYLDSLTDLRRSLGLPSTSINWGAWDEAGQAAAATVEAALSKRGVAGMSGQGALDQLEQVLRRDQRRAVVAAIDWPTLLAQYEDRPRPKLLEAFAGQETSVDVKHSAAGPSKVRETILSAAPEERRGRVTSYLSGIVAEVMGLSASETPSEDQELASLGLDSLMAIQVKNRVEIELGFAVPMAEILDGITIGGLAERFLESADARTSVVASPTIVHGEHNGNGVHGRATEHASPDAQWLLDHLDEIADDDVDRLIQEMSRAEGG